ncbi:Serpin (serine protease inhibitor) family protein [Acanthocheilonema viteae]
MIKQAIIVALLLLVMIIPLVSLSDDIYLGKLKKSADIFYSIFMNKQFDLALNLIKEMGTKDRSVIVSPISISAQLFGVYLATHDETRKEISEFLGKSTSRSIQNYFGNLLFRICGRKNDNYTFNIANRLYVPKRFSIKPFFSFVLQFYFKENLHYFTYERRNELIQEVNNWAKEKTNGRINELMGTANINPKSKMLLFNTMYFKNIWKEQFISASIWDKQKKVSMMALKAEHSHYIDNFVHVLKLPYVYDGIQMIIILPKQIFQLSNVRNKMTKSALMSYIGKSKPSNVTLILPKFQIETELNLKNLKTFGDTNIFSKNADFQGISDDPISVSNIIHRSFFEINEKGTEIACETESGSGNLNRSGSFIVDQPFLFFVVREANIILYAGQYGD